MKILYIRNFLNKNILDKTLFIPKREGSQVLDIDGSDTFYGEAILRYCFFIQKYQNDYDYLIFVDEDCLILDENIIHDIIEQMETEDYDIAGCPDGNIPKVRLHRYDVPNLFFTIFKSKRLRDLNELDYVTWHIPELEYRSQESSTFEPYYHFMTFAVYNCKCRFLELLGNTSPEDELTTVVYYNKKEVCIHTWYAREYGYDAFHTQRIEKMIDFYNKKENQ